MSGEMRAQPQVGPEHVAVLVPGLEQVNQAARQPHAERHRTFAAAVAQALAVEEDDEVDVAREIQLAGAQLAHAEHEHAATPRVHGLDLAAAHPFAQQVIERLLHRAVGEGGQGRGDPLQRPEPVEVAQADQQRLPPSGAAQAGHEAGTLVERDCVLLGAQSIQCRVGALLPQQAQDLGLGAQCLAEEGAAGEDPAEQRLVAIQSCTHERREPGIGRGLGQMAPALQSALGQGRVGGAWRRQAREAQLPGLSRRLRRIRTEDRLRGHPRSTLVRSCRRGRLPRAAGSSMVLPRHAPRPEP